MKHAPNATRTTPLVAGVLIGGESRRMGRPKHLLPIGGITLVERLVAIAARAIDVPAHSAVHILGAGALPPTLSTSARIADVEGIRGPLSGILAALRFRPDCAWLILACDLPRVSVEALRWLVGQRSADAVAVMPQATPGRVEPLLALYEPQAAEGLERMRGAGRSAPRELSAFAPVLTPTPPDAILSAWTNVNSPEDWSALLDTRGDLVV